MISAFDLLFWLAFGVSISPGIGTGFFGILFTLVFGFFLACVFFWLSVLLLFWIPQRLMPPPETKSTFRVCIGNVFLVFGVCLLIGVLVFDRWISDMVIGYFFGKYALTIVR